MKNPKANKLNELQHGEFLALNLLQQVIGEFLALSKHIKYVDSLLPKIEAENDLKLGRYYTMIAFMIHEFKKVADKDPAVAEVVEEGDKLAFLAGLGMPGHE